MLRVTGTSLVVTTLLVVSPSAALAAPDSGDAYVVNRQSSTVGFTLTARVLVQVHKDGRFADFAGDVSYDPVNPADTKVDLTVYTASVDMKDAEHEALLRSDGFFDTEHYPTMQFVSRGASVQPDGTLAMTGDLTIHGVTKRLVVPWKVRAAGQNSAAAALLEASFKIDRTEFGLVGRKNSGLKVSIGKSVDIHLAIAATRAR